MCYGCYTTAGSPAIINEKTKLAADMIKACSEYGAAHIVVEDWNLEDSHLQFCINEAGDDQDCIKAMQFMQGLTMDERHSAMALAEGFIK